MKMTILNSNPDSIKKLIAKFQKQLPQDFVLTPITIEFGFVECIDDIEANTTEFTTYDFYDENLVSAEFDLQDANLLFDETRFNHKSLVINEKKYKLMKYLYEKPKRKKTPK